MNWSVGELRVRPARIDDLQDVSEMCHRLWPDSTAAEHAREMQTVLLGKSRGTLPEIVFVSEDVDGRITGFVEAGLRSHAESCNPAHPVGYIEGWYVAPEHRRRKIGTRLIQAAEEWARSQRCVEMASDAWLGNIESQQAHQALGFEEVDRCVHYRKRL